MLKKVDIEWRDLKIEQKGNIYFLSDLENILFQVVVSFLQDTYSVVIKAALHFIMPGKIECEKNVAATKKVEQMCKIQNI